MATGLFTRDRLAEIWGTTEGHQQQQQKQPNGVQHPSGLGNGLSRTSSIKVDNPFAYFFEPGQQQQQQQQESQSQLGGTNNNISPKTSSQSQLGPSQSRLYSCWSNNSQEEEIVQQQPREGGQAWENVWDWVQSSTAEQQQQQQQQKTKADEQNGRRPAAEAMNGQQPQNQVSANLENTIHAR
jgi:hypothetical protein